MKLKLTPLYILSFLSLTFFVHEVHDWAHTLVARLMSGEWGPRGFDSWQIYGEAYISTGKKALATIAGPIINFILLWNGRALMDDQNFGDKQSLGCSMVFAALPLNSLLAAFSGGGDLTSTLRFTFTRLNSHKHSLISVIGLILMLIICLPPLIRAFVALPWWRGKFVYYPIFLIVPGFLDRWLVGGMLNKWFIPPGTPQNVAYGWVLGWTGLTFIIWILTRRSLSKLIDDDGLPL